MPTSRFDLTGRVALVTGANHGIGAATSRALSSRGASVLAAYWPIADDGQTTVPLEYRRNRAKDASEVIAAIRASGGRAVDVEADLRDAARIPRLFAEAERHFGPVDILINNASSWISDTFAAPDRRFGHMQHRVSLGSLDHVFAADAPASAPLIAGFPPRPTARARRAGRSARPTAGGP